MGVFIEMPAIFRPSDDRRTRWAIGLVAALPLVLAALVWWRFPVPLIDADTPRYLDNSAMRTATYPLFLDLFSGPLLLPLQLLMFAGALSWLALYLGRLMAWPVAVAVVLAAALNPYVWELQRSIMAEALTTPLLVLTTGCIVGFAVTGRIGTILWAAVLCGLAATARPALVAMVAAPLLAVWLGQRTDRVRLTLAIALLVAAPIVIEKAYSNWRHGPALTSPLGRHAFMKAAVIDAPPTRLATDDPLERRLVAALNSDFAPVRDLIRSAPDRNVRYILLSSYEACAAWPCGNRITAPYPVPEAQLHRALFRAGSARLKDNPLGLLELTATEYHRMWLLFPRKASSLAEGYNAFLAAHSPLPFQPLLAEYGRPADPGRLAPFYAVGRAVFAAMGVLALVLIPLLLLRRKSAMSMAALALLVATQGVLVLSALVAMGLPRYPMGLWPALVGGLALGGLALVNPRPARPA